MGTISAKENIKSPIGSLVSRFPHRHMRVPALQRVSGGMRCGMIGDVKHIGPFYFYGYNIQFSCEHSSNTVLQSRVISPDGREREHTEPVEESGMCDYSVLECLFLKPAGGGNKSCVAVAPKLFHSGPPSIIGEHPVECSCDI